MVMVLTRYLGVSGFGDYTIIFAFTGFFSVAADLGLYLIAVREIAQRPAKTQEIMGNVLGLRMVSSLAVVGLGALVGFLFPYSATIKWGILIVMFSLFFMTLNQSMVAVFQADMRIDKAVWGDVLGRATILLAVLILVKKGSGLLPIVSASVLGAFLNFLLTFILSFYYWKLLPLFHLKTWKYILQESLPMWIVIILGMVYFKVDTILLSVLPLKVAETNSYAVGIYGAPYKILEVLITLPAMFAGAIFPVLSKRAMAKNRRPLQRAFARSFEFIFLLVLPISVSLFLLSPSLVNILGGVNFAPSILILQLLSLAMIFIYLTSPLAHTIIALGKQRKLVLRNVAAVLFNVLLNLILIPYFAAKGAAVATILTEGLIFLWTYQVLRESQRDLKPRWERFPPIVLATALLGLAIWGVNQLGFLEQLALLPLVGLVLAIALLGALLYLVLLLLFRVISWQTIRQVLPLSWKDIR